MESSGKNYQVRAALSGFIGDRDYSIHVAFQIAHRCIDLPQRDFHRIILMISPNCLRMGLRVRIRRCRQNGWVQATCGLRPSEWAPGPWAVADGSSRGSAGR